MVGDDVLRVDRGIPQRRPEVEVAEDLCGDVRRQTGAEGIGGKQPSEVVRREGQRSVGRIGEARDSEQVVEVAADARA